MLLKFTKKYSNKNCSSYVYIIKEHITYWRDYYDSSQDLRQRFSHTPEDIDKFNSSPIDKRKNYTTIY